MATIKQKDLLEIRSTAEYEAEKMRGGYDLGIRDIGDIFRFIEQALGYLLLRYPFGEEALDGFSALYLDERLIVTNSSKILSRERFTAAHELGHHVFDFTNPEKRVIADKKTGLFSDSDLTEYRADCFATALLMPKSGVEKVIHEMGLNSGQITYKEVIRLQIEFGVSYRAMARRLNDLGIISEETLKILLNYYDETGEGLRKLFHRVNAPSTNLLDPTATIWIPSRYLRCLEANYEQGLISYPVLQKILASINVSPEEWGFEVLETFEEEDIDNRDINP